MTVMRWTPRGRVIIFRLLGRRSPRLLEGLDGAKRRLLSIHELSSSVLIPSFSTKSPLLSYFVHLSRVLLVNGVLFLFPSSTPLLLVLSSPHFCLNPSYMWLARNLLNNPHNSPLYSYLFGCSFLFFFPYSGMSCCSLTSLSFLFSSPVRSPHSCKIDRPENH